MSTTASVMRPAGRVRAALAYVVLFGAIGAQAPYLVLYYQSLGFDLATIGLTVGLASVVGLLAAPAWGALSDRLRGSPFVVTAATAAGVAGAALLMLARPPLLVAASAAILSAGMAGLSPIIDARALETAGGDRSGYGPLRAWGSASYIVAAFATGATIERWGIGAMFPILASCLVATGAVGVTLRPAHVQAAARPLREASRIFGPRGLALFLVGAFLTWASVSAVAGFYSLRFAELGAPASIVGLSSAVGAAVEVPIMLWFPSLALRFGAARILVAGAGIFVVRAILASLTTEPAVLVLGAGIGGVGFALFLVGGVTWVSRHAPPELAATAQGIFQGVTISLSAVVAATAGGAIAARIGLAGLYLLAAGLGAVAAGIIALAVRGAPGPRPQFRTSDRRAGG